jgi:lipopolysaccharide transport system permease protein
MTRLAFPARQVLALTVDLAKRDIASRYRGSVIGMSWSFLTPMLMLAVYTFVFGVIFQSRWPSVAGQNTTEFALVLFAGLIVFGLVSETLQRAPSVIVGQPQYVKKMVFPLGVLPAAMVLGALFHSLVSVVVLLLATLLVKGSIPATAAWFPVVFGPVVLACLGLAWALSATGVYMRDMAHVMPMVATVMLFLSPIFYPLEAIPESVRGLVALNPLGGPVDQARQVLLFGQSPEWRLLGWQWATGIGFAAAGHMWFRCLRRRFADVL